MNSDDFKKSPSGRLVPTISGCMAFVPNPMPPTIIDLARLALPLSKAMLAVGELGGLGQALPDPQLLIRPFSRVEAIASSKIEGTVTSVPELLILELAPNAPRVRNDTREVHNYTRALNHGLGLLPTLPISSRFFCELHKVLLDGVRDERGVSVRTGELKQDQNWIGAKSIQNARFVPPPPDESKKALGELEKYIHQTGENDELPLLIKLALIHYQFEAIHPFPDGNGRLGRLLIPLLLCERKVMAHPLLYLSAYFERHNDEYIDRMFEVSRRGFWDSWIEFFLEGVERSARNGIKKANALKSLHTQYSARVRSTRSSGLLGKLVDSLFSVPAITVPYAMKELHISYNAAKHNLNRLVELKIITPAIRDERPQWFFAQEIMGVTSAPDNE